MEDKKKKGGRRLGISFFGEFSVKIERNLGKHFCIDQETWAARESCSWQNPCFLPFLVLAVSCYSYIFAVISIYLLINHVV